VQEGDAFAFGSDPREFVHQRYAGRATLREHRVEVVDGETQVMDAGTALLDEAGDRRVGTLRFEQFDKRVTGGESSDARAVAIIERYWLKGQDVTKEGRGFVNGSDGEADVRDARCAGWSG
jgi:hypothetical protein